MRVIDTKTTKRCTIEYSNEEEFRKHKEYMYADYWVLYRNYITPYTCVVIYEKEF